MLEGEVRFGSTMRPVYYHDPPNLIFGQNGARRHGLYEAVGRRLADAEEKTEASFVSSMDAA